MITEIFTGAVAWAKDRLQERTTWDGAILIGAGVAFLVLEPFAKLIAYGAILYGAWTIWKNETDE
jgi:hypothetical protein